MAIQRTLAEKVAANAAKFRVIAIVGPRQSGKTTLARQVFPDHTYLSFEDLDTRNQFIADPRGFVEKDYGNGVIFDEFQHVPELLSYMQGVVDRERRPGYFVLTGSHNFLMQQAITQSLAGRVAIHTLLPLSCGEMEQAGKGAQGLSEAVIRGGYPEVVEHALDPTTFAMNYIDTYVSRDVKQLVNIKDAALFQRFIRMCAARTGQLLNITALADDCGIATKTVEAWLSILEASYVLFRLQPYFKNFNKQLTKAPKLYFYDTSLACFLLRINSVEALDISPAKGGLVESFIISDMYKHFYNQGAAPSLYFWRDSRGHEVDCLLDRGDTLVPVEIKSSQTFNQRFFEGLVYWCELAGMDPAEGWVVYAGNEEFAMKDGHLISWRRAAETVGAQGRCI